MQAGWRPSRFFRVTCKGWPVGVDWGGAAATVAALSFSAGQGRRGDDSERLCGWAAAGRSDGGRSLEDGGLVKEPSGDEIGREASEWPPVLWKDAWEGRN